MRGLARASTQPWMSRTSGTWPWSVVYRFSIRRYPTSMASTARVGPRSRYHGRRGTGRAVAAQTAAGGDGPARSRRNEQPVIAPDDEVVARVGRQVRGDDAGRRVTGHAGTSLDTRPNVLTRHLGGGRADDVRAGCTAAALDCDTSASRDSAGALGDAASTSGQENHLRMSEFSPGAEPAMTGSLEQRTRVRTCPTSRARQRTTAGRSRVVATDSPTDLLWTCPGRRPDSVSRGAR